MTFGALIEGETFLVAGGIAAQQGLFHLPGLIALALVGSMIHDGVFFYIGRFGGAKFFEKRPGVHQKLTGIIGLFDKYGVWLILALRFAYGLRTLIPTAIGMSHISNQKFWLFDIIGGFVWSCTFILAGYVFGSAVTVALHKLHLFEGAGWKIVLVLIMAVVVLSLTWLGIKRLKRKHKK